MTHQQPRARQARPIAIFGASAVGLFAAVALAQAGCEVRVVDADLPLLRALCEGVLPYEEPGLQALLRRQIRRERLEFSPDFAGALAECDVVLLALEASAADRDLAGWNPWDELALALSGRSVHTLAVLKGELPRRLEELGLTRPAPSPARMRITLPLALIGDEPVAERLPAAGRRRAHAGERRPRHGAHTA
jgi:hypothetical protein